MSRVINNVDVICQHKADGEIIPIRFRLLNEDGEYETYKINAYRTIAHQGCYSTPDGVAVTNNVQVFECNVLVLDYRRRVRLYFDRSNCRWRLGIGGG